MDYLAAVEHSDGITRRQYQKDAAKIAEVQKGILVTSQNEKPFDVFICYKETDGNGERTRDSILAQDIYYQLTEQGRRVFFARLTLEDKIGTQYEPYIFAALNSAKVMVVVGTSAENLNAVWVKNEWSRFLALMKKDRSKLLLPCYRDMDPYDLPEQLSVLQSYDMSKIGFIQDLTRGITKVLDADKKPEPVRGTQQTAAQQNASGNANTAALLERAFMFLEDGDWARADEFCEQILNQDPRNPRAYLGKLMAELRIHTQADLKNCDKSFTGSSNYDKVMRFGDAALQSEMKDAISHIHYTDAQHAKQDANSESAYKTAARKFAAVSGYRDADRQEKECLELAEAAKKDVIYKEAVTASLRVNIWELERAYELFRTIPGWRDSDEKSAECQQRIDNLKAEAEAKRLERERLAELRKKEEAERAKRNKKIAAIVVPIGVVLITFLIVLNTVIIPNSKYSSAVALMDAGKYEEAIAAFSALNGHKDSTQKISDCETAMLNAQYDAALVLMDAGQYEEAISAFSALDGHKDSEAQIADCQYSFALALIDAKKYEEAYDILVDLGAYKNAEEVLRNFKTVYQTEIEYFNGHEYITEYSYDAAGNCTKKIETFSNGNETITEYSYDAAGNCIKEIIPHSDGTKHITEYSYDAAGNCIKEIKTSSDGHKYISEYSYDAAGNCIKEIYTFGPTGDETITEYSYDAAGNCIKKIDTLSSGRKDITEYSYDAAGNCIKKIYTWSSGNKDITEYSYDAAGNCIEEVVTQSNGYKYIHVYRYEDRLVFYIPAE